MAWRDFPLPDGTYSDVARPWSQQDIYNYLPVFAEQAGTRSRMKLACAPGLDIFASVGEGPHRGARDVEGTLFVVSGHTLYSVTPAGVVAALGTIPGTGPVCMTHNQITDGNEVVIGNRISGYVYNTATSTFAQITDDAFPGLAAVDFLGQYVLGVEPMRRYWFHSDLVSATSYNALNQYQAETSPDRIVGLCASHNEALIFGERTIEPWVNAPTENAAFQLNSSAVIEKGCASANTICRLDNRVFFLGNDKIVYALNGYTPQPISTKPMEAAWRDLDASRAFAFTYEDRGHVVYYLTFPDGQTWGFDVTAQRWHRRESYGLDRWRLNTLFKWNGSWYGGDFQNGFLYELRWDFPFEGASQMPRGWRSGVMHSDGNRISIPGLKLLLDTGKPRITSEQAVGTMSVAGDLPDGSTGETVAYSYAVSLAYPGQDYTLAIVSGAIPAGLSMSSAGAFTGIRTTTGSYEWVAELRDGAGRAFAQIHDYSNTWAMDTFDPEISQVRYKVVESTDTADYSDPAYDDSAWSLGLAPFGNVNNASAESVGFALVPATNWPLGKTLWYRARVTLSSTADLTTDIFADDAATAWANGVQFYDHASAGGSGLGEWYGAGVSVPAVDLVVGDNVLVFKSRELWGGQSYFDYRLSQPTYTPPETPASPASSVTTIATASTPSGLLQLRYSNNGGHTYSDWRLLDIGSTGSFIKELVCRRLGLARHRVWEVRDTSDAPADVLSVMLDA